MVALIAALACACVALGALLAACVAEVRRMAAFLALRKDEGCARVTVRLPLPALVELASAVNGLLDAGQAERLGARRRSEEFRRGLASLSHDIRTPLMGAKGRLQLAEGERDGEARATHLTAAAARIEDVEALLDALFSYARTLDPDLALERERVEVVPLLERVLAGHYDEFVAQGMEPELSLEDPTFFVEADREALVRVFENVVANALRHGTGTRLRIVQRGHVLLFSNEVADPGAVDPTRIFDRFWRAGEDRSGGGSGMGLAIVASLCERMGLTASARLDGRVLTIEIGERASSS